MPDLTPVGLSRDGSRLVLRGDSGSEYTVVVDHRFRAALRGDEIRLAQLETPMETALRPRDIQSRIRSGQSPETVAAAAGTTVDRIGAFAAPVLAERAHVAERAQRATVRRPGGDGTGGPLGDAVAEGLRRRGVDPATVRWDAWRRDDGRWALVADYGSVESPGRAEFGYDAAGRYVTADDEESRRLVGEGADGSPARAAEPPPEEHRSPVPAADDAGQLPLGADAIELVTGVPAADPGSGLGVAGPLDAAPDLPLDSPDDSPDDSPADSPADGPAERPRRPARRTKGRAAVPSWDEIMFGSGGGAD